MSSVGFVTTLQRGAEWAATGKVTQEVPVTFPTAPTVSCRVDLAAMDPTFVTGRRKSGVSSTRANRCYRHP